MLLKMTLVRFGGDFGDEFLDDFETDLDDDVGMTSDVWR